MPTSEVFFVRKGILSFPKLIDPSEKSGRYEATLLLDPNDPVHQATIKQIEDVARTLKIEKWGEKKLAATGKDQLILKNLCYGTTEDMPYDGYEGKYRISGRSDVPIVVVDMDGKTEIDLTSREGRSKVYAGCKVNGAFSLWTQDNEHGKGINGNLIKLQYAGPGEPFSGRVRPETVDFDEVEAEEMATDDPLA
jgi:hypothetical protein